MAIEIFMPALSPTMEKGTLAKWLVKEGDTVSSGDVIAEIETDKATMEVESIDDGTVAKILVAEGAEDVPVGQIIAVLAEEGEDVSAASAGAGSAAPKAAEAPKAEAPKAEAAPAPAAAPAPTPAPAAPAAAPAKHDGDRVFASPLARRIASQAGLDIAAISGSGPKGRVVKADVEAAMAGGAAAKPAAAAPAAAPAAAAAPAVGTAPTYGPHADIPYHEEKLSGMRKTIARRLTESKQHVPHFYLTVDCELDKLLKLRGELNKKLDGSGTKLSVNDFIIRASALALRKVPAANVQYAGDKMYWYERADISVAVAIEGGLVTPVVRGADGKGLADISNEVKELASKAKDGKLMPEDYAGGTFSISNLGMYGIKDFGAVVNPPQGAILAVGAGEQRPVVKDGALAVATVMSVTLSCDHRAIDGAVGAEFLGAFKALIEDPVTMLL